ncbi:MAG TPA: thiamine pyrophosphate-binding protein [Solirubrobacterales bacterium]
MKAATWWAEYLRTRGIRFAFGQGGLEVVEHLEALRAAGIDLVWTHHESTAAFAAAALGELTAVPGLCVATRGPGGTNMLTGVAHALLDRAPLLAVTGDTDPALSAALPHQNLPMVRLFEPVVKRASRLTAENVRFELPAAFDLTTDDPPGPVFLAFPQAEASREVPEAGAFVQPVLEAEANADPKAIATAACRIASARRPALFVGLGARELEAERLLVGVAEALGAPVVVTPKAKGYFPADHPLFAGVYPAYQAAPVKALLRQADLVVGVGLDPVEMLRPWPFEIPVVAIGPVAGTPYFPDCLDVRVTSYPSLVEALGGRGARGEWPAGTAAATRCEVRRLLDPGWRGSRPKGLAPQEVLAALRRALRRDAIVTCDVGSHRQLAAQAWPTYWPRTFLTSNGLSSVGFALPAALAAKLECPDRQVCCLVGDGGLLAALGDLQTLVRLRLGVLIVVWADEGSSNTKLVHEAAGYPTGGTFTGAVDFEAVARSLGLWSATIGANDRSASVFEAALAQPGPALVQVPLAYDVYRDMEL